MHLRSLLVVSLAACAAALPAQSPQKRAASHTAEATITAPTPSALNTAGLNYSRDISRIYWGDLDQVHIDRSSMALGIMMNIWMRTYGLACAKALPKNSVEIMNSRCTEEEWQVYVRTGIEVPGSRTCRNSEEYGSGIYADPDLYRAQRAQAAQMAAAMLGQLGSIMSKSGDAGVGAALGMNIQSMDTIRQARDLASDMKQLVAANGCETPAVKRYEHNLTAFATRTSPIRMAGIPTESTAFHDSDYQTLLDDLVAEQSQSWMFNRFSVGSIANVAVGSRNAAGKPTSVTARYAYQSNGKPLEGSVELRFENGVPHCLVYADLPDACRLVSPRLVAAYEDGHYVTDHPAVARTYTAPDLRQVQLTVDQSQPVDVEVAGGALRNVRPGLVMPMRGKLVHDLRGIGPGGSAVLLPAGSPAMVSIFITQRGTQRTTTFHLGRVGVEDKTSIYFPSVEKVLPPGVDPLLSDGSPFAISFTVPAGIRHSMLLTDFEKNKTAIAGAPLTSAGSSTSGAIAASVPTSHHMLLAGSQLTVQVSNAVTVGDISSGKLIASTVIAPRNTAPANLRGGDTLPAGSTVYLRVTQQGNRRYLIEGDHAVVQGVTIPLVTNGQVRVATPSPGRSTSVEVGRVGPFRIPSIPLGNGSMVLLQADVPIHLVTRTDVALDAVPQ